MFKELFYIMYNNLMDSIGFVTKSDPEVGEAMQKELARQKRNLELIASENIVSPEVMAAMGSVLINMQRAIRVSVITADVNVLILLRILLLKELKSFLVQTLQMYSLIQVHRQILLLTLLFSSLVIPFLA